MAVNYKAAGPIVGSPLCGLCERMCIEVRQVFDGCTRRADSLNGVAKFTDFTAGPPYEFVRISFTGTLPFSDLVVTTGSNCSQVEGNLNIPLTLTYIDGDGCCGTARGLMRIGRAVSLRVPAGTLLPYTVEATVVLSSDIGSFISADTVNFTYCVAEVIKIIVPADILVPTYGYAVYPDCTECGGVCPGIMAASFFPPENNGRGR